MTKKQVKTQARDLEKKLVTLLKSKTYMNYNGNDDEFAVNLCHMNRSIANVLDHISDIIKG